MSYSARTRTAADKALRGRIDAASSRLHRKLVTLGSGQAKFSDYLREYLAGNVANLPSVLQHLNYLLFLLLRDVLKPLREYVFVDYGGGCGLFSLLAKEVGIG